MSHRGRIADVPGGIEALRHLLLDAGYSTIEAAEMLGVCRQAVCQMAARHGIALAGRHRTVRVWDEQSSRFIAVSGAEARRRRQAARRAERARRRLERDEARMRRAVAAIRRLQRRRRRSPTQAEVALELGLPSRPGSLIGWFRCPDVHSVAEAYRRAGCEPRPRGRAGHIRRARRRP